MSATSEARDTSAPRWWSGISGLPVDLRRLILVGFVEVVAVNFYASMLMPYYRSLGYGSEVAGVLSSILQVACALVAAGSGFMADSLGRKRLYTVGQVLRCAAVGLLLATRSYGGLVLVSIVRGLAYVQQPASSAIFASHTRQGNRATLLGVSQTAQQAAAVVAPLLAGIMADRLGIMSAFGVGLVLAGLAVVIAVPIKDRTDEELLREAAKAQVAQPVKTGTEKESARTRVSRMFRENRPAAIWALLTSSLSNGMANGAANILLPFMIMDRFSSAYTTISASSSFGALGTMLVLLIGGRIADLKGRRGLVLIAGTIAPVLIAGLLFVNSLWQMLAVLMVITMIGNISSPAISAVYMEAVGARDRATFAGLQMCLNSAGLALGSIGAGIGYKVNPTWTWVAAIILFASQVPMYAIAIPKGRNVSA